MVRVGSLFSGIGALDIAVCSALGKAQTSWFVESEGFCQEILSMRFPGVPVHGDVREVGCESLSPVDILVGGFPCQDLSCAGRGAGISEETRSGLFFQMWRLAQELQPRFVLFENVPVITSRGLDIVTETIIAAGWTIEWHCLAASDVGALHRRERWWGIAHREDPLFDGYRRVGQYQDGCRVLQGSLFGAPDLIERLPKAGMACADGLFERDSDPAGFSTYPTPTASDWKGPNRSGSGSCSSRGLATVVDRMWPTPRASKTSREDPDTWSIRAAAGKVSTPPLATAVEMEERRLWPTPSVSHAKRGNHDEPIEKYEERCLDYYEGRIKGKPGISLGVAVRQSAPVVGRLNPGWVEVLMGLPEGWTDPERQVAPSMIDASSWSDGSWEEGVPRLTDRTDSRNKRLKALGNSVVPQCAAAAFEAVGLRIRSEPTLFKIDNCWHCRREDCDIEIPEGVEVCVEFLE
jgi:site-specific DNA-cytosine methylase